MKITTHKTIKRDMTFENLKSLNHFKMLLSKFYCVVTFIPTEQLVLLLKMLKRINSKHFSKAPNTLYSRNMDG